jgi:enamine deaminase RidA (YjgF/YER057c/UK114 family)
MERPLTVGDADTAAPGERERSPSAGPHQIVNPVDLSPPAGFAHAVVAAPGRLVFLGGQTAHAADGTLPGAGIVEQFDATCANVLTALEAAGAQPEHVVWTQVFTSDGPAYLHALRELGRTWQAHFGRHYPATAWFEVKSLFDPAAIVEIMVIAVIPDA